MTRLDGRGGVGGRLSVSFFQTGPLPIDVSPQEPPPVAADQLGQPTVQAEDQELKYLHPDLERVTRLSESWTFFSASRSPGD